MFFGIFFQLHISVVLQAEDHQKVLTLFKEIIPAGDPKKFSYIYSQMIYRAGKHSHYTLGNHISGLGRLIELIGLIILIGLITDFNQKTLVFRLVVR